MGTHDSHIIGDHDEVECARCERKIRLESGDPPPGVDDEIECEDCGAVMTITDTQTTVTLYGRLKAGAA